MERDLFVLGEIPGVPIGVDISNRMVILPIIDEARVSVLSNLNTVVFA